MPGYNPKKTFPFAVVSSIILGLTISCAPNVQSIAPVIDAESKPTPTINPESLCERLAEIKSIPFKDEPVYDPVYNDLIASGKKAVPA